jgi:hypothetical protein
VGRKRGAPPGNQNARKHGFYSKVLTEAEQIELQEAATLEGLDNEIAILRVKLQQLLQNHPERIDLQLQAANILARLIRTRYNITPEQKKSLKEAIATVIKDIAIPLGVKFIP